MDWHKQQTFTQVTHVYFSCIHLCRFSLLCTSPTLTSSVAFVASNLYKSRSYTTGVGSVFATGSTVCSASRISQTLAPSTANRSFHGNRPHAHSLPKTQLISVQMGWKAGAQSLLFPTQLPKKKYIEKQWQSTLVSCRKPASRCDCSTLPTLRHSIVKEFQVLKYQSDARGHWVIDIILFKSFLLKFRHAL